MKVTHHSSLTVLRWSIELLSLGVIILLTYLGRLQLWLGVFAAGVVVSTVAGRYFCGWVCPMNTLFRLQHALYRLLGLRRISSPSAAHAAQRWVRGLSLIVFAGLMVGMRIAHIRINMLLFIMILSFVVTLFIEEEFWHRWVCPFGTILSVTSHRAGHQVRIDQQACVGCGVCQKQCPSGSIITVNGKERKNLSHECLMCYQCVEPCPVDCIGVTR